jgi:hypothetical protein
VDQKGNLILDFPPFTIYDMGYTVVGKNLADNSPITVTGKTNHATITEGIKQLILDNPCPAATGCTVTTDLKFELDWVKNPPFKKVGEPAAKL